MRKSIIWAISANKVYCLLIKTIKEYYGVNDGNGHAWGDYNSKVFRFRLDGDEPIS